MNVESPWFKKVLSEIKDLDRRKREMEKNFSWEIKDDYNDIVRKETVEAVDLLKFGADNRIEGDSVVLTIGEDTFRIPKDILSDELGTDQYNLLVNNAEEADDASESSDDEDDAYQQTAPTNIPKGTQPSDIRLPDGRKVPASLAPMLLFTQAMEKTIAAYTGGGSDISPGYGLMAQPQIKVKSKTTGELLRNIADLQQQVLAIEDEKERVLSGGNKELEEARIRNKELESSQKQAEDTITMLRAQLADIEKTHSEESGRTAEKLKEASALIEKKDKELSDVRTMLNATQTQIRGIKQSAADEKAAAEQRALEAEARVKETLEQAERDRKKAEDEYRQKVENATKAAQNAILEQKEGEISSLEADYHVKLDSLKNEYDAKVKELQEKNSGNADRISSLNASIDALSADKEKAAADAKAEYEKKIAELNQSHAKEVEKLQNEAKASADRVRADIRKEFEDRISEITKEKERTQSELDRAKQQQKSLQDKISDLRDDAYTDILTGLKNDRALNNDIGRFSPKTVARVSILGMKAINESQGFDIGNTVISMIADELEGDFPGRVYRTMGDQFVIFPKDDPKQVEEKIKSLDEGLVEQNINIAYGIGVGKNAYQQAVEKMHEMHDEIYSQSEDDESEDEGTEEVLSEEDEPDDEETETVTEEDEKPDDDGESEDEMLARTLAEGEEI